MILGFFAALMAEEWWVIWIFILSPCLLMALLFRPQKYDAETAREITWMRKFFLSLSLVFTQVFTYLPFKREPSTHLNYAIAYYSVIEFYYCVNWIRFQKCDYLDLFCWKYSASDILGFCCIQGSAFLLAVYNHRSADFLLLRSFPDRLLFQIYRNYRWWN